MEMPVDNSIVRIVLDKMLMALGLHIRRCRFHDNVPGVTDVGCFVARKFIDKRGWTLTWYNRNPMRLYHGIVGNGIGYGSWTVFKDDDRAILSLFTEKIDCYKTCYGAQLSNEIANPFYGCRTIEEVLVRCDLLGI